MKKILPLIFSLFLVGSVFGAAGDVIFKQINDNGTAVADRVIPLPFPFTDRLYGFNAANSRPVQMIIGAGLSVSGTYPNGLILTSTGSGGTVTSVGLSMPSGFSVTNSPVTTSGTLTVTTTLSGIIVGDGSGFIARTITGTSNEITVTNGTGISGNPTLSLPSSLTFTGKTITGGTYTGGAFNGTVGATTPSTGAFTTVSASGDLNLNGTGQYILGDFSGSAASRPAFKTSTANGGTFVGIKPDGTGTTSSLNIFGLSDVATNSFRLGLTADSTQAGIINVLATGSATSRPLRMQIQSSTVAEFTSTGINSTAIGATTPAAGEFTTLKSNNGLTTWFSPGTSATAQTWFNSISGVTMSLSVAGDSLYDFGTTTNNGWHLKHNGTRVVTITSSGIDGTVIGAVDPRAAGFSASGAKALTLNRNTSDGTLVDIQRSAATVGSISVTTTATAYNTSSDRRLKTNIRDFKASGPILDRIQPRIYDWKSGEKNTVGFVAQELYEVYPSAVTKGDNNKVKIEQQWAVDYSKLVPVLVAEVQSLRSRVKALEKK